MEGGIESVFLFEFWRASLIAFKLLKRIAYVTLINTYEANKNERIVDNAKEFMNEIFPLMENKE